MLGIGSENIAGFYATMKYFQSLDNPNNKQFVDAFKSKFGSKSVIGDVTQAAYLGPWLWKAAVEKAGGFDIDKVVAASPGIEGEVGPRGLRQGGYEPSPVEQDARRAGAARWPVQGGGRVAATHSAQSVPEGLSVSPPPSHRSTEPES